jgi:glycine betaine/proline transport system ATP-binding protein
MEDRLALSPMLASIVSAGAVETVNAHFARDGSSANGEGLACAANTDGLSSPMDRNSKSLSTAATTPILSCRQLWKVYGGDARHKQQILSGADNASAKIAKLADAGLAPSVADVSLEVKRGEILMIMGLSGSGKSTIVRCLSRLVEPDFGEIEFEGINLKRAPRKELIAIRRRKIGMVFQNFGLMDHLSAIDNVAFPLRVQGVPQNVRHAKAREMLELVGLAGREEAFPRELSGGQQQRVGIARSLITNPDLWFLDEPFSALDPLIRKQMQDEFLRLQAKLHKTIVFVTHDFLEAARLGDRIAIMRGGEIVQIGSVPELILNPADDYVRSFVADVPVLRVIRAGQIAEPISGPIAPSLPQIDAGETIEATLSCLLSGAQQISVIGANGELVGLIGRKTVERFLNLKSATNA